MTHLEDAAGERACYRYRTEVILGRWRRQPERAIDDAIAAGPGIARHLKTILRIPTVAQAKAMFSASL